MKAVQLLYSYLLVEKPFSLESQPSSPTKEKRFAYGLYLNLVYLMTRLANQVKGKNKTFPLAQTRFILKSETDERIQALNVQEQMEAYPFRIVEDTLKENIKESLLFREFEKKRNEGLPTDKFWEDVFNAIILTDSKVNDIIKNLPGYSLSGVERMKEMMAATFKNFYASGDNIEDALNTLERSLQKSRDLYMRLLALTVELTHRQLENLENNRKKFLATSEDLNPNMRLVNNRAVEELEKNQSLRDYIEKNHLSWKDEDPELLDLLLKAIQDSDIYKNYLSLEKTDFKEDSEFWRNVISEVILNDRNFLEFLENKSVFWNDDLEIMTSFVLKTFKRLENPETASTAVLPRYKDGDDGKDAKFGSELVRYVLKNKEIYRRYIEDALKNDKWEADRLAFMDVIITMTALAEILNYPEIPLQVSINEYIEIAKSYSSEKSGQFVNGLLATILQQLNVRK